MASRLPVTDPVVALLGSTAPLILMTLPLLFRLVRGAVFVTVKPLVPPRALNTGTPLRNPVGARVLVTLRLLLPPTKFTSDPVSTKDELPDTPTRGPLPSVSVLPLARVSRLPVILAKLPPATLSSAPLLTVPTALFSLTSASPGMLAVSLAF